MSIDPIQQSAFADSRHITRAATAGLAMACAVWLAMFGAAVALLR